MSKLRNFVKTKLTLFTPNEKKRKTTLEKDEQDQIFTYQSTKLLAAISKAHTYYHQGQVLKIGNEVQILDDLKQKRQFRRN